MQTQAAMRARGAISAMDRLAEILAMLQTIETLTLAGQRHNIVRITGLLEEEASHAGGTGDPRTGTIAKLLAELRREAGRLVPDVRCFTSQAAILIGLVEQMR